MTLNGQAQTLNAQMSNFAVTDGTGSGTGWNVTVNGDSTSAGAVKVISAAANAGMGTYQANSYSGTSLALAQQRSLATGASGWRSLGPWRR